MQPEATQVIAPSSGVPQQWPAPPPTAPPQTGTGSASGTVRIGKGVTASVGSSRFRDGRGRLRRRWGQFIRVMTAIVTVVLLVGASWTAWQWWHRLHDRVTVTGVSVAPPRDPVGTCDVRYDIVGTVATNGQAGAFTYEWVRSDGQRSGTLTETVGAGQRTTTVHLYWTFTGDGTMAATATLRILTPSAGDAAARFQYSCAR